MRRRSFTAGIVTMTAVPRVAFSQNAMPVIGFLSTAFADRSVPLLQAFRHGLSEAGFEEGRNVAIEYRWAEGRNERLSEMARDLVARKVAVIAATGGSPSPLAAKAASNTIPIVFQVGVDPVAVGLVASINRPGGNITGATMIADVLHQKRVELLREMMPGLETVGLLANRAAPGFERFRVGTTEAAAKLALKPRLYAIEAEGDIPRVLNAMAGDGMQGVVIAGDALFNALGAKLGALTLQNRLPAIHQFRPFVSGGGLMSYGGSITDAYRVAGVYTGRVLKGEKPADLPVQQSTKVELMLNLKTAKALGIEVPLIMIARADEVIE
jgi:putative ABC transport system substrate-binding protein